MSLLLRNKPQYKDALGKNINCYSLQINYSVYNTILHVQSQVSSYRKVIKDVLILTFILNRNACKIYQLLAHYHLLFIVVFAYFMIMRIA